RLGAYDILETIVRNILRFSEEQKYRRLRRSNERLQSQLFSVPGAIEFLDSLGFVNSEGEAGNPEGECLVLPKTASRELLDQGLEAINFLRCRDREGSGRAPNYLRMRQALRLEVRRERCEKAKAVGELHSYICQEFSADDAGDGLYTSLTNIDTLHTILTNIISHPNEEKYRRLRLGNNAVYKCVLQQRGALELLLECAGGELVEESGEKTALLFPREAGVSEDRLRYALRVLEEVKNAVHTVKEEIRHREYEEAKKAMRSEVLYTKMLESRQPCHGNNTECHQALGSAERDESQAAEEEKKKHPRKGQRIPIKEAVRILMGKVETDYKR
ncbi:unnamed protein product, partial [Trypanosoma congolense IL3000]